MIARLGKIPVFFLFLFVCNSALLFFLAPSLDSYFECDSRVYDAFGRYFYEHGRLFDPTLELVPMQPVGYHFFIGLVYTLFSPNVVWIILIQLIMALGIGILTYHIARQLFNEQIALITLFLFSINLGFLIYTQLILAEILQVLLFMIFWERILKFFSSQSRAHFAQAAIVLSASVLIKPVALIYVYPFLVILFFYISGSVRKKISDISLFAVIFFVPIFLYTLRNYLLYGVFHFAPMMEVNLYQCLLSKVIARVEGRSLDEVVTMLKPVETNLFDPVIWQQQREFFYSYLVHHPSTFITVWIQNVFKTILGLFTTQIKVFFNPAIKGGSCSFFAMKSEGAGAFLDYIRFGAISHWLVLLGILETVWNVIRMIFVAIGVCQISPKMLVLFSSFVITCVVITGVDGCFRYRLPCEPFLMMATAAGIYRVYEYVKNVYRARLVMRARTNI